MLNHDKLTKSVKCQITSAVVEAASSQITMKSAPVCIVRSFEVTQKVTTEYFLVIKKTFFGLRALHVAVMFRQAPLCLTLRNRLKLMLRMNRSDSFVLGRGTLNTVSTIQTRLRRNFQISFHPHSSSFGRFKNPKYCILMS